MYTQTHTRTRIDTYIRVHHGGKAGTQAQTFSHPYVSRPSTS